MKYMRLQFKIKNCTDIYAYPLYTKIMPAQFYAEAKEILDVQFKFIVKSSYQMLIINIAFNKLYSSFMRFFFF